MGKQFVPTVTNIGNEKARADKVNAGFSTDVALLLVD
jgi:hypothetical protein